MQGVETDSCPGLAGRPDESTKRTGRSFAEMLATIAIFLGNPVIARKGRRTRGEAGSVVEPDRVRLCAASRDEARPLHFANEIVPLLTRHGCNAGGCHGKASGQNGFKLSLFGFDPDFDYDAIVKEAPRPARLPGRARQSLLLTKADRPGARTAAASGFDRDSEDLPS